MQASLNLQTQSGRKGKKAIGEVPPGTEETTEQVQLKKIKGDLEDAKASVIVLQARMTKELKTITLIKKRLKAKSQIWADNAHDMIVAEAEKQVAADNALSDILCDLTMANKEMGSSPTEEHKAVWLSWTEK